MSDRADTWEASVVLRQSYSEISRSRAVALNPAFEIIKDLSPNFYEQEACGCGRPLALELVLLALRPGYIFEG